MHKISIIIPTLNEEHHIQDLLTDITNQTYLPSEIIVVDGTSVDKTIAIAKKFKNVLTMVTDPNPASQRTIGGKKAKGTLLVFLDADVRLEKTFLKTLSMLFEKKQCAIACPFYIPHKSSLLILSMYLFFDSIFYILQKILPSGAGSCIIVKKKAFSNAQGFTSDLQFDDIAFIRKVGWNHKFSFLPIKVYVSDRRFRRDGVAKTFFLYMILSVFFLTNQFKLANRIHYKFAHYK